MKWLPVLLVCICSVRCQNMSPALEAEIYNVFGTPPPIQKSKDSPGSGTAYQDAEFDLSPTSNNKVSDNTCRMESGEPGVCVAYYLCNSDNGIITDGVGLIDLRIDGDCGSYLDVCCLPAERKVDPIKPPALKPSEVRKGCGWRNPDGIGFRIKGNNKNEAMFGEFPWMVAILKQTPIGDEDGLKLDIYVGGGSLIHPLVVLTSAHVVKNNTDLRVRAGEWDTQTQKEIYPHQDRMVREIVLHERFNPGNLFNDIALLFLNEPMKLTQHVGLACLPRPGDLAPARQRCMTSGWGKDQYGKEGLYQVILKRVEVPVVEHSNCQQLLRTTRLGRFFELNQSFMCAGTEPGHDACIGDGGSPLVCPIGGQNGRYQQSGIVAWGIGCGDEGIPGVYADVAHFRSWIDREIFAQGLDTSVYSY